MNETITLKRFADIDSDDVFFDSLKEDYPGFESWFERKSKDNSEAYVQYTNNNLQAFLYLKNESGEELTDITPTRPACNRLKVGTFKIDAHNTKLGERFVKKIMDTALFMKVDEIYVTIFPKHEGLIHILQRYCLIAITVIAIGYLHITRVGGLRKVAVSIILITGEV